MLDPSFGALLDHLNWSPPAIVQPAPTSVSDRRMTAYADYVTRQEERFSAWMKHGSALRDQLWRPVAEGKSGLDVDDLSKVIMQFEDALERGAVALARKEKEARRDTKFLPEEIKALAQHHQSRLLKVARDFYREARDFAAFLRALRAEMSPDSRGGPAFEDATALEAYLLKNLT